MDKYVPATGGVFSTKKIGLKTGGRVSHKKHTLELNAIMKIVFNSNKMMIIMYII